MVAALPLGIVLAFALCSPVLILGQIPEGREKRRVALESNARLSLQMMHARNDSFYRIKANPELLPVTQSEMAYSLSREEKRSLENRPARSRLYSSAICRVPTMANAPGQFGAFFKTRLMVLNVTTRSYRVYVNTFGASGKIKTSYFDLASREMAGWDNFLDAVGVTGAAAAEFDAWFDPPGGSELNEFLVTTEVYTESPNGRYKTVVQDFGILDEIGASFSAFSPGVFVNSTARTNIGCFNRAIIGGQTVSADLMDHTGQLLKTYSVPLVEDGWGQIGVADGVTGGYIRWRPQQSCLCWAVVVDNTSNDGSFIPARQYIP